MGWDYVSEPRTPTDLLFIPQMIYEHGEPWWDHHANRENLLTRIPELFGNPIKTVIWEQLGGTDKRSVFPCNHFCSHLHVTFFTCRKIWHSASGFTFHPKKGVLRIFIALKHPLPRLGLNLRPLRPVASTLTTTQPRRLHVTLEIWISNFSHVYYTSRPSYGTDLIVHTMHDKWWGKTY
jgi:hypothetical protein